MTAEIALLPSERTRLLFHEHRMSHVALRSIKQHGEIT